ncbi:hypothetical protein Pla163_06110 [Planctomycetes bacterium Pla163]|uniref:DUF2004 domain-containing protein n=1 Tax=Rohdeia mirabilis TaxID=2528008 RepID=A0A518CWA0_9BACT|nr:hypothetical protein Pla163_06110 [Planctomycetes bacterium Pla163]
MNQDETARRERIARDAILSSLGQESGEYGATLFATHHLAELDEAYWQEHAQAGSPEPRRVLEILELKSSADDEEEGLDQLDFGLPGGVSDYVLCVSFDEEGEVDDISMES